MNQVMKTIAVRFLDGMWQILSIPVPAAHNGDTPLLLNLDHVFNDRSTCVTFKGFSTQGRMLYVETNCKRKIMYTNPNSDNAGKHLTVAQFV